MHALIITAQPNSNGFTHKIAKQYAGTLHTKGDTSEIIDLYASEYQLPFLSFENEKEIPENQTRNLLQQKITDAKKIIFVFPMWWSEYPAIVKNFIDNVFTVGFAFRYSKGMPEGLLTDKISEVYMTCDAPRWLYFFFGLPFKKIFSQKILGFCGIKVVQFKLFGNIRKSSEEEKSSILQTITSLALK